MSKMTKEDIEELIQRTQPGMPFDVSDLHLMHQTMRELDAENHAFARQLARITDFLQELCDHNFEETRNFTGPHPADEVESTTPHDAVQAFQEDAKILLNTLIEENQS